MLKKRILHGKSQIANGKCQNAGCLPFAIWHFTVRPAFFSGLVEPNRMRIPGTSRFATPPTKLLALPPRRSPKRWLPAAFVLIGTIVLADALVGEQSLSSERRVRKQYDAAGAELSALRGENARLREEVRRLREDPDTIEYVARRDLGLARRGEILVVVK